MRTSYLESKAQSSSTSKPSSEHSNASSTHSSPMLDIVSPAIEMMDTGPVYDLQRSEKRLRTMSELHITEDVKDEELLTMYKEAEMLEEQADILHYLSFKK